MNSRKKTSQKGFTLLELLIATAVFSLVLIVFLSALVRISQMFYKGVNLSNTQEATRNAMQTIADDMKFYDVQPKDLGGYFCIGNHRYSYVKGVQVGSGDANDYGIVREIVTKCKPPVGAEAVKPDAEKLLDPGMQLNNFVIEGLTGNAARIQMLVVFYGSDKAVFTSNKSTAAGTNDPNDLATYDAYQATDAQCTGLPSSSQFCATADYQTTILQKF